MKLFVGKQREAVEEARRRHDEAMLQNIASDANDGLVKVRVLMAFTRMKSRAAAILILSDPDLWAIAREALRADLLRCLDVADKSGMFDNLDMDAELMDTDEEEEADE